MSPPTPNASKSSPKGGAKESEGGGKEVGTSTSAEKSADVAPTNQSQDKPVDEVSGTDTDLYTGAPDPRSIDPGPGAPDPTVPAPDVHIADFDAQGNVYDQSPQSAVHEARAAIAEVEVDVDALKAKMKGAELVAIKALFIAESDEGYDGDLEDLRTFVDDVSDHEEDWD